MNELTAVLYGLIQGLTEFLPISSSGHLALLPHFLEMKDPGVAFDLMMHVGTALAVIVYYHKILVQLLCQLPAALWPRFSSQLADDKKIILVRHLIFATLATLVPIFFLRHIASSMGRTPLIIGVNLIFFGFLLALSDYFNSEKEEGQMETPRPWAAIGLGLFQALAIFPGVSRSGITMSFARFLKFSRKEAADFSFLLSLPIILGGALEKAPALLLSNTPFPWKECVVGVIVSFFVGLLAIHFLIKFIQRYGLWFFALYRLLLGLLVIFMAK